MKTENKYTPHKAYVTPEHIIQQQIRSIGPVVLQFPIKDVQILFHISYILFHNSRGLLTIMKLYTLE